MRNLIIGSCALLLGVTAQAAELKIAVVDPMEAMSNTTYAKEAMAQFEKETTAERNQLIKLEGEVKVCQKQLSTDAATMSATQQASLKATCDPKYREWVASGQAFQKMMAERQQAIVRDLAPRFQQAIEQLVKEGGYDLIVQREALMFARPDFDISAKVSEKLNAPGAAAKPGPAKTGK